MNYQGIKTLAIKLVSGAAFLFTIGGCAHYKVDFDLEDSNFKARGKSVAVISGTKEQLNVVLAKMISDTLRKKSRYQVASSEQIAKAMEPYPQTIKGPYKSAYFVIDTDWDLGDRKKIANIQHALGVDYLYVIWAPIAVTYNKGDMASVPAVAQLFESPNARVIAKSTISVFVGDENNAALKEGIDELVRQIAEKTHMASGGK